MSQIIHNAFAKINIGLRIVNKRIDGFHDIETIFHRVNIHDVLTFEESDSLSLLCTDPSLPLDETNICIRAATLLKKEFNCSRGVRIRLEKNIPIGGGLGGGSSNAAATLVCLNRLWNINAGTEKLEELALRLGSDVPYFLHRGSAYAIGRGEILKPLPLLLPYWIVVVHPNINISTTWAYSNIRPGKQPGAYSLDHILRNHLTNIQMLADLIHNDFEPSVTKEYPVIRQLIDLLKSLGAEFAQLSGSGSSVYGFFRNKWSADKSIRGIENDHRVFLTPPNFNPVS